MEQMHTMGGAWLSGYSEKDYRMKDYLPVAGAVKVPDKFRLPVKKTVYHQGPVGSCVAFTDRLILEYAAEDEWGWQVSVSNEMIYHYRPSQGDFHGRGMIVRNALDNLRKYGACDYHMLPGNTEYNRQTSRNKITESMKKNGAYKRIESYARLSVNRPEEIAKALISNGLPLQMVIPSCPSLQRCRSDRLEWDGDKQEFHSVAVVGYEMTDEGMRLIFQNSWGPYWGADGFSSIVMGKYPIEELWSVIDAYIAPPDTLKTVTFEIGNKEYTVNGLRYQMDTVPVLAANEGRAYVPLRFAGAALGCNVQYLPGAGFDGHDMISVYDYTVGTVLFYIGQRLYVKGGKSYTMDAAPYIDSQSRTMVPLRALAEALDFEVKWEANNKPIHIFRSW